MPDIVADPPVSPCYSLFRDREAGNFNHLILISFPLARGAERHSGNLPRSDREVRTLLVCC